MKIKRPQSKAEATLVVISTVFGLAILAGLGGFLTHSGNGQDPWGWAMFAGIIVWGITQMIGAIKYPKAGWVLFGPPR